MLPKHKYGMRWYDMSQKYQMEFLCANNGQEPILILRHNVFTNPLEHYNTWDSKIDTSQANVLEIALN